MNMCVISPCVCGSIILCSMLNWISSIVQYAAVFSLLWVIVNWCFIFVFRFSGM